MSELLDQGIIFFNAGSFFEAHEVWEEMWRETVGPRKIFYQGLIHAAVGLHHRARNNSIGAQAQIEKSLKKLEVYPADYCGIDVAELKAALQGILAGNPESDGCSICIKKINLW